MIDIGAKSFEFDHWLSEAGYGGTTVRHLLGTTNDSWIRALYTIPPFRPPPLIQSSRAFRTSEVLDYFPPMECAALVLMQGIEKEGVGSDM